MPPDVSQDGAAPVTREARPLALGPVERVLDRAANAASWLWLALIGVIVSAVVLRFGFGIGRIELEELQWHLYAVGFLSGIVGCAIHDRHVRVDVLRERMSARTRDWIDFYGVLLFQIPLIILVLWSALPFVAESFMTGEKSASAGGLPYRFLLKSVLPLTFAALFLASLARLARVSRSLFRGDETRPGAPRREDANEASTS